MEKRNQLEMRDCCGTAKQIAINLNYFRIKEHAETKQFLELKEAIRIYSSIF